MKKIKLLLLLSIVAAFSTNNVSAHSDDITKVDNMTEQEEQFFSADNVISTETEEVDINGEKTEFVLQEFSDTVPILTYSGEPTFVERRGLEILDKSVFDERQSKINSRINTNDRYADGRGTYLYAEITYTKTAVPNTGLTNYNMTYLYCNSSGSTLTAYSVTYGQSGVTATFAPINQIKTVNLDTTLKTYSTSVNWKPIANGYNVSSAYIGMTQKYTCRGWTNSWQFSIF